MDKSLSIEMDRINHIALVALLGAPKIGNTRAIELVEYFGSPENVISSSAADISQALSMKKNTGEEIINSLVSIEQAEKIVSRVEGMGARLLTLWDDEYPTRLKNISDPPVVLYVLGEQSPLYNYSVAIVGTRSASDNALHITRKISQELVNSGITVVSGMANGIDTCAHDSALQSGGRTIAVLGCGVDVVYPPNNRKLYERIVEQGAIFSEYPPGTEPERHHFPQRNRIISGLCLGVLVVEAGLKSGALITAHHALEQGRELFATPGAAGAARSIGVNSLLRENLALLVESGAEIIEHLRSQLAPVTNIKATLALPKMSDQEKTIYDKLEHGAKNVDELTRETKLSVLEINRVLTSMQLKGIIRRLAGARIERS